MDVQTALTPQQIETFRKARGWTEAQLGEALGVSKRAVQAWKSGANPAPYWLRLAFAAIEAGLEPWAA